MIPYTKYQKHGDLHWQWYNTPDHSYRKLVDESLEPFTAVPPGRIIDIGSGDALPLSLLFKMGFKCAGVEPMKEGVDLAMQHNVSAEYFIETAEKFADRNFKYDYLYSLNTIEHMDDPTCMVKIMKNIKNFGVIVTDDAEVSQKHSQFHTYLFNHKMILDLFKDFDIQELELSNRAFMGFIIKPKSV